MSVSHPQLAFYFLFYFFVFLGPHLQHVEVPRLRVQSKLQLPAYATATATPDLSHIHDPHCSYGNARSFNPLSKDQTHILMDTSWVLNPLSHNGNSSVGCLDIGVQESFLSRGSEGPHLPPLIQGEDPARGRLFLNFTKHGSTRFCHVCIHVSLLYDTREQHLDKIKLCFQALFNHVPRE